MKNLKNFLTSANAVILTKSGHKTLASRLATSRPLGERGEPCLAAKRPTASDDMKSDEGLLESLIRPQQTFER